MDLSINGPKIIFGTADGFHISETVIVSWLVVLLISVVCIWLTKDLSVENPSKKQVVAEKLVLMLQGLVDENMGEKWRGITPYIGALFSFSLLCSLSSLLGFRAPTADYSTTLAMALVTFCIVQITKFKVNGFFGYFKSYTQPLALITPLNVVSELANPISMSFRHFGNLLAGLIINVLLYGALASLSTFILQIVPIAFIQSLPLFQIGLPAVLSLYFDIFTSFMQAYIFCMLTMVFTSMAADG